MDGVEPEPVLAECESIIARHPADPSLDIDESCYGDCHSHQCHLGMEYCSQPCIKIEAERAKRRRNRIKAISLKNCARDPAEANGQYTLEGLVQESCIYYMKYLSHLPSPSLLPFLTG